MARWVEVDVSKVDAGDAVRALARAHPGLNMQWDPTGALDHLRFDGPTQATVQRVLAEHSIQALNVCTTIGPSINDMPEITRPTIEFPSA